MTHPLPRHPSRLRWPLAAALLAAALVFGVAQQAQAQDDDEVTQQVEELSAQGVELYSQGKFKEAIASFEQAYRLAPVANLLYNIALCWEKLDEPQNAVATLERFIVADDADPGLRAKALDRSKTLNEEIERRRKAAEVAASGNNGGEGDKGGKGDEGDKGPGPGTKRDDGGLGGLGWAGILTAGGGVLVVGGGAVFGVLAQGEVDNFEAARTFDEKDSARGKAEDNALLADILYGVGGAAIVGGLVMLALDVGGGEEPAAGAQGWRLVPVAGQGAAGALLGTQW